VIQYWPEREHVPTWKMRSLEELLLGKLQLRAPAVVEEACR